MTSRVQSESATGASERVRMMLTLSVESVDFDTAAGVLRVHGRNVEENEHVKASATPGGLRPTRLIHANARWARTTRSISS